MPTTHKDLEQIFQFVFDNNNLILTDDLDSDSIDGWDSLAHIEIIIMVEKKFRIRFSIAEISNLKRPGQNVGTFRTLIQSKLT